MKALRTIIFACALVALAGAALAEGPAETVRRITVTGKAEIQVPPDRVSIEFGLVQRGKELKPLLLQLEERVKAVLAVAARNGVDPKDVQSTDIEVETFYDKEGAGKKLLQMEAKRTVCVRLTDLSKFDALMIGCVEAGINEISDVTREVKDIVAHRKRAREMAVRAAREKAETLAGVLGQQVGPALTIEEGGLNTMYGLANNVVGDMGNVEPVFQGSLALGTVNISADVKIVFELK